MHHRPEVDRESRNLEIVLWKPNNGGKKMIIKKRESIDMIAFEEYESGILAKEKKKKRKRKREAGELVASTD